MPLIYALKEFKNDKQKLWELLICLNCAAEISPLINEFLESGEMMHPLLEEEGILCRIPNWWKRRGSSVRISIQLDKSTDVFFGLNSLLKIKPALTVDGIPLTPEEVQRLLTETTGFAQIKGKWIEVDKKFIQELLNVWRRYFFH